MQRLLGHAWVLGDVGIVAIQIDKTLVKVYIGKGKGLNEKEDIEYIKNYGSPFPVSEGLSLIVKIGILNLEEIPLEELSSIFSENIEFKNDYSWIKENVECYVTVAEHDTAAIKVRILSVDYNNKIVELKALEYPDTRGCASFYRIFKTEEAAKAGGITMFLPRK